MSARRFESSLALVGFLFSTSGCVIEVTEPLDASSTSDGAVDLVDGGGVVDSDTGGAFGDATVDSGALDVGAFDAGEDAGFDAGEDAGFDAGEDAGFDAGEDAGLDAGAASVGQASHYWRLPFGSVDAPGALDQAYVEVPASAVPSGWSVRVHTSTGTVVCNASGATWRCDLPDAALDTVSVELVDSMGRPTGDVQLVLQNHYVLRAHSAAPVIGYDVPQTAEDVLWQRPQAPGEAASLAALDAPLQYVTLAHRPYWRHRPAQVPLNPWPNPRRGAAVAYDSVRGRTVLFGGIEATGLAGGGVWELDGDRWTVVNPSGGAWPAARHGHAMAFFPPTGEVILFGGETASGLSNETWAWNGARWRQIPSDPGMHVAKLLAMAYDPSRRAIVLSGGLGGPSGTQVLTSTWQLDDAGWSFVPVNILARYGHAMAFDADVGTVIVNGGRNGNHAFALDVHSLGATRWTSLLDTNAPRKIRGHRLLSTPAGTLLLGGVDDQDMPNLELRRRDPGGTWTTLSAVAPELLHPAAAYDRRHQAIVSVGGETVSGARVDKLWMSAPGLPDVWGDFRDEPTPAHAAASAFDGAETWLYGGRAGPTGALVPVDQTARWSGTAWRSAASPPDRTNGAYAASMAAISQGVLLFGGRTASGFAASTAEWSNAQWLNGARSSMSEPAARSGACMGSNPLTNEVLMHGGNSGETNCENPQGGYCRDTWRWNAAQWVLLSMNSAVDFRVNCALGYDEAAAEFLMFGGLTQSGGNAVLLGDTWRWTGSGWALASASAPPRSSPGLAYHPVRRRLVMFGGGVSPTSNVPVGDLVEWTGTGWAPVAALASDAPPPLLAPSMSTDRRRQRVVLSTGNDGTADRADVWELVDDEATRPALLLDFDLTASLVPTGQWQGLRVVAQAGGLGSGSAGAEVAVWSATEDRWVAGSAPSSTATPSPSENDLGALGADSALQVEGEDHLWVRVAPISGRGLGPAPSSEVVVDLVQVELQYAP